MIIVEDRRIPAAQEGWDCTSRPLISINFKSSEGRGDFNAPECFYSNRSNGFVLKTSMGLFFSENSENYIYSEF